MQNPVAPRKSDGAVFCLVLQKGHRQNKSLPVAPIAIQQVETLRWFYLHHSDLKVQQWKRIQYQN